MARAEETGGPLRVHTCDGEVIVARVLSHDDEEIVYIAESSSRPERYAVCDATGFALPWHAVERAELIRARAPGRRARARGAGRCS